MRKLALALLLALPGTIFPQTFSLITGREPVTSLDGLWRFHIGDNPAWASPNLDDSQWPLIRSGTSWTEQGYFTYSGYAWYRFSIQVADGSNRVSLLLPRIYTGYRVYANGKLIGGSGSINPTLAPAFAANPKLFRLPAGNAGPRVVQIAIRVWEYRPVVSWVGGGTLRPGSAAGDPVLLAQRLQWLTTAQTLNSVSGYAYGLLATVIGLTILALFLLRRSDREYLWFSMLLLGSAADAVLNAAGFSANLPFLLFRLTDETLIALDVLAALVFFSTILKSHRSFWWWAVSIAAGISPLSVAIYYLQWAPVGISYSVQLCCLLPAYIWIIAALSISCLRKDASARLLLAPAVLLYGTYLIDDVASITFSLGWRKLPSGRIPLLEKPFPVDLLDVVSCIFVFALLIFLVRRFSLARKEEERLAREFEAAKSVQSLLIPALAPATPGFAVESVYLPASEVGGDFFQVLPGEDGSLLIAIGDVSGKGMPAAMTVSLLVGTFRTLAHYTQSPAEILNAMNQRMQGRSNGGFTTCLAVRIDADGSLTAANAGHIAPYVGGREMSLENRLPLGLTVNASYPEMVSVLAPGVQLTLVTDGVVEAQNQERELFGFDRTRSISTQSAEAIAQAAQHFGQEDDITVLTLTFAPAEVLHA